MIKALIEEQGVTFCFAKDFLLVIYIIIISNKYFNPTVLFYLNLVIKMTGNPISLIRNKYPTVDEEIFQYLEG